MASLIADISNAQIISYVTMASGAAMMYDQVLNFSQEVDLIWNRPRTIVTVLYFVARYCGPVSQLAQLAATMPLNWTVTVNTSISIVSQLSSIVFTTAMQAILLIRAYALCSRSRKVLVLLLVGIVFEMIAVAVCIGMSSVIDTAGWLVIFTGPDGRHLRATQLAFDILLLIVALFASVKHALQAKGWSVNPLVKALAEDQIAYFVWYAVWKATGLPTIIGLGAGLSALDGLNSLFGAFAIIAGPHMVISLRAQELKTQEGTLQTQLSTIQFDPREPIRSSGSRHEVDSEA
ncbi:hypothetical protein BV22DRAFT_792781 [Leucogyrophana mollusca]|uniref:Uncharacterized protein n=1 Tax=Leucogyrophana mollusca TaxID=85980 RepID=A0ACB8B6U4_9AGAM|nr:hypothetical protein BV22DRAFT_792781 [Leucogyrophana mollusca]